MNYWDGQPVRFVCCERKRQADGDGEGDDVPWGRVLWCVAIELVPDEAQPQSQQPHAHAEGGSRTANGATNGAESSHHQPGNGEWPTDGVD